VFSRLGERHGEREIEGMTEHPRLPYAHGRLAQAAPRVLQATCESLDRQPGDMRAVDLRGELLRCLEI
jgi:hypothetical protein